MTLNSVSGNSGEDQRVRFTNTHHQQASAIRRDGGHRTLTDRRGWQAQQLRQQSPQALLSLPSSQWPLSDA